MIQNLILHMLSGQRLLYENIEIIGLCLQVLLEQYPLGERSENWVFCPLYTSTWKTEVRI